MKVRYFSSLFCSFLHTTFLKHEKKLISPLINCSWWILVKLGMVWTHSVPVGTSWVQTIPRFSKITTRRMSEENIQCNIQTVQKQYFLFLWPAFTWPDNKYTYFFKGDKYWRFNQKKVMSDNYPRLIKDEWSGIPDNIDAGMIIMYYK